MIYIYNNVNNKVVTDSYLNRIPNKVDVVLSGELIGEFDNISIDKKYIVFYIELPRVFECKEYTLKLYDNGNLIKTELVCIDKAGTPQIVSVDNKNKIKQYERRR